MSRVTRLEILGHPALVAAGRADLVRAWAVRGEPGLAAMARLLGYERTGGEPKERPPKPAVAKEPGSELGTGATEPVAEQTRLAPIPFWRLEQIEQREPDERDRERRVPVAAPIDAGGLGRRPGHRAAAPPLVADARLWQALRRRLASTVPSRSVDVEALAARWSRGRPVRRIPYRAVAAWAPQVDVLVDRSDRLVPFWEDQDRLVRLLARHLGRAAIREQRFIPGLPLPWRDRRTLREQPVLYSAVPVLAFGDLGFLAGEAERSRWRVIGRRLERLGAPAVALVPLPPERWEADPVRIWETLDWQRPAQAPRPGKVRGAEERRARAERLLALVSFALRVEPGLLRTVRRLLPVGEADAGTEADAWAHPDLAGAFAPAAELSADGRRRLQAGFASEGDALKRAVVAAMRSLRAGDPEEIWLAEVLGLAAAGELPAGALLPEEIEAARRLWGRLAATADGESRSPAAVTSAVLAFTRRTLGGRLPDEVWRDAELQPLLWRAWAAAWRGEGEPPLPAGVSPGVLASGGRTVGRWQVGQVGAALIFARAGEVAERGSPLVELASANARLAVYGDDAWLAAPRPLGDDTSVPLTADDTVFLRTDHTRATLRRLTRPEWAAAMGRDPYGLWAAFDLDGAEHRLRWIRPGSFLMGSPEAEDGRWPDEGPRHVEVIEGGFWLGETPCTQALWEAVTGENPSRFKGAQRPVEQVSWEECEDFCRRLGRRVPGLDPRLPTEVEWEYACRAGTESATYAGELEILGESNPPVLDPIAWYGGNSGRDFDLDESFDSGGRLDKQFEDSRAGTRVVAQKRPNPWGLYDMLGNVHEWCADRWRADYTAEAEGSYRVIRGGSWSSGARIVRAAYRDHGAPSGRWDALGFRLARGQGALRPGAEPERAERARGDVRRGTRRRRRGRGPETSRA